MPRPKGFKCSDETKKKMSNAQRNRFFSEEHRRKLSQSKIGNKNSPEGENNSSWKGDDVGYRALHHWVTNKLGKANMCDVCGMDKVPNGLKRYFQWANLSGKYLRDLKDWRKMCVVCHKKYDKKLC